MEVHPNRMHRLHGCICCHHPARHGSPATGRLQATCIALHVHPPPSFPLSLNQPLPPYPLSPPPLSPLFLPHSLESPPSPSPSSSPNFLLFSFLRHILFVILCVKHGAVCPGTTRLVASAVRNASPTTVPTPRFRSSPFFPLLPRPPPPSLAQLRPC